jgi:hypothetical protein
MNTTTETNELKEDRVIAWGYLLPAPEPAWLPGTIERWEDGIDAAIQRMLDEGRAA